MTDDAATHTPETLTPQTAATLHTSALRLADIVLRYAKAAAANDTATDIAGLEPLNDELESALRAFNTATFHHTGTAALLLDPQ